MLAQQSPPPTSYPPLPRPCHFASANKTISAACFQAPLRQMLLGRQMATKTDSGFRILQGRGRGQGRFRVLRFLWLPAALGASLLAAAAAATEEMWVHWEKSAVSSLEFDYFSAGHTFLFAGSLEIRTIFHCRAICLYVYVYSSLYRNLPEVHCFSPSGSGQSKSDSSASTLFRPEVPPFVLRPSPPPRPALL